MGFFGIPEERANANLVPVELFHKQGCKMCPLDREARRLEHPKMESTGAEKPLIYVLGEGPGRAEDEQGKQFVGASGKLLREHIPKEFLDYIRWNNAVNCRTSDDDRDPTNTELECCRPRIVGDIEKARPDAIFGMGGVPLTWAGKSNITAWRGRRFPIKVGSHTCWYFPFLHPAYLLYLRKENEGRPSNLELAFKFDMKRAFDLVASVLPVPEVHTEQFAKKDITCFHGKSRRELDFIADFLEAAAKEEYAGVDYETQGLRPYAREATILTAAVAVPDLAVAFAMDHPEAGWTDRDKNLLKELWRKFLRSPVRKISHHLHFESEWSAFFFGADVVRASRWEDSLTQAYTLDERKGGHSLEFLCQVHFGINIKQITGNLPQNNMKSVPLARLLPYNGIDGKYHLMLFHAQKTEIEWEGLQDVYEEKLRQVPTCVLTQMKGIPVDRKANQYFSDKYGALIAEAEGPLMALPEVAEFKRRTGEEFKPGSDKDVLLLVRDIIGVAVSGTDKAVLDKIDHPFGKLELAWRNATKMKSTYVDPCSPDRIYPDGLLHTYFGTCQVDTGRLNSHDPNVQNFPKHDEANKETRRQIAPPGEGIFLSLDYGQIEARLIASASRDPTYCKATWDGYDVHGHWARRIAKRYPAALNAWKHLDEKSQMEEFRQKTKNKFVFPSFFTAALRSVAGYMDIPEDVLKPEYEQFWRDFAGIKTWQDSVISKFKEVGYIECFNGRRRRAPLALGQAINAAIQGSAADVAMDAMNRLSELEIPELQPIIMLHDDLTFWFRNEREMEDCVDVIVHEMLNVKFPWLCVPLVVDLSIGKNWCDMKRVDSYSSDKLLNWPIRPAEFK